MKLDARIDTVDREFTELESQISSNNIHLLANLNLETKLENVRDNWKRVQAETEVRFSVMMLFEDG